MTGATTVVIGMLRVVNGRFLFRRNTVVSPHITFMSINSTVEWLVHIMENNI